MTHESQKKKWWPSECRTHLMSEERVVTNKILEETFVIYIYIYIQSLIQRALTQHWRSGPKSASNASPCHAERPKRTFKPPPPSWFMNRLGIVAATRGDSLSLFYRPSCHSGPASSPVSGREWFVRCAQGFPRLVLKPRTRLSVARQPQKNMAWRQTGGKKKLAARRYFVSTQTCAC